MTPRKRPERRKAAPPKPPPQPTTCGEFGGTTENGSPCMLTCGWGTGRLTGKCAHHTEEADKELATLKAIFLAEYSKGTNSAGWVCDKIIKRDLSTVWRWRQRDAAFAAAYDKVVDAVDDIRGTMIEDSQFKRIVDGKHHAAEGIFWLVNRRAHRWKQRQEVGISGTLDTDPRDIRRDLEDKIIRRLHAEGLGAATEQPNAKRATRAKA